MKKIIPVVLIAGLAAWYFLGKQVLSQNLNFVLRKISFGGRLFQPKVFITLGVQNPTNNGAVIRSIVAKVSFKNNSFANVSTFAVQNIAPQSESLIVLTAEPSVLGIFNTIRDAVKSKEIKGLFSITGSANVDGVTFPINIENTI
jgi:hypothetical protein